MENELFRIRASSNRRDKQVDSPRIYLETRGNCVSTSMEMLLLAGTATFYEISRERIKIETRVSSGVNVEVTKSSSISLFTINISMYSRTINFFTPLDDAPRVVTDKTHPRFHKN